MLPCVTVIYGCRAHLHEGKSYSSRGGKSLSLGRSPPVTGRQCLRRHVEKDPRAMLQLSGKTTQNKTKQKTSDQRGVFTTHRRAFVLSVLQGGTRLHLHVDFQHSPAPGHMSISCLPLINWLQHKNTEVCKNCTETRHTYLICH